MNRFRTSPSIIAIVLTACASVFGQPSDENVQMAQAPSNQLDQQLGGTAASVKEFETFIGLKSVRDRIARNNERLGERVRLDGNGLTVVVIDSGINAEHRDFNGEGKIPFQLNLLDVGVREKANDEFGHGTHIAGLIVANEIHQGIAPLANVIPIRVLDDKGNLKNLGMIHEALNWVLDNKDRFDISVVNISIAMRELESNDDFPQSSMRGKIKQQIGDLKNRRIAVVCAAGNEFQKSNGAFALKTLDAGMAFPAIVGDCISVGAVYSKTVTNGVKHNPDATLRYPVVQDQIAPFSNRLHRRKNSNCHTDIFAPGGGSIVSTGVASKIGESEYEFGGTSQSAAIVSGAILLLQQFYRDNKKGDEEGELPSIEKLLQWLEAGEVIKDGDDEFDEVRHTCEKFVRLDLRKSIAAMQKEIIKQQEDD